MGGRLVPLLALFSASYLGAIALRATGAGHLPWYISRASGLAAFAAISASVIFGLLVTTRAGEPRLPRPLGFELHSFLAVLSLALVGVHAGALLFDNFVRFSAPEVLVPFTAPHSPAWTGLGVVAAWAAALVTASFFAKKRLGHARWRRLHYASFAVYVLSLAHGLGAGTDSSSPPVYWGYVVSAAAVAALVTYRVLARKAAKPKARARPAPPALPAG